MGRRLRSQIKTPNLFFVTTTFVDRTRMLNEERLYDEVENLLFSVAFAKIDSLMGYILMPSHVHLLAGCSLGGLQLSEFMRSFKSLVARQVFPGVASVWMKRFDDLIIKTDRQFQIKLNYIHNNPVRVGLVDSPVKWRWSSVRFWIGDEPHQVLRKDWDWLSRGI